MVSTSNERANQDQGMPTQLAEEEERGIRRRVNGTDTRSIYGLKNKASTKGWI